MPPATRGAGATVRVSAGWPDRRERRREGRQNGPGLAPSGPGHPPVWRPPSRPRGSSLLAASNPRAPSGSPPVPPEIEGAVGPELDPLRLEACSLEAGGDVRKAVGGTTPRGVHDPVPGNPSRAAVKRPADGARREPTCEKGRDLPVGHHSAPRDSPDVAVDLRPCVRRLILYVAVEANHSEPAAPRCRTSFGATLAGMRNQE